MSKIRINELARELEVKPNVILDLLPELGVTDKKTHSSSLDDDVVLNLRRRVAGMGAEEQPRVMKRRRAQEPATASRRLRWKSRAAGCEECSAPRPRQNP